MALLFMMDEGIGIHHLENMIENLIGPDRHNRYRRRAIIKHRNREYYENIIPRFFKRFSFLTRIRHVPT